MQAQNNINNNSNTFASQIYSLKLTNTKLDSNSQSSMKSRFINTFNNSMFSRIAKLSQYKKWVLLTAQCPRISTSQLMNHNACCTHIIQIKDSQLLSEAEIVKKAICSGNASLIMATNTISSYQQINLENLAKTHHCEVIFIENNNRQYH